ncbi:MAG: calcium/sodium antiporter [Bacteroidota bacterium]
MVDLLIWIGVFVLSLTTLIISADFFIRACERIGIALGIPEFIIGVTIIAVGTSLPEMVTNIVAVLDGVSEIVAGNVIGSNITNICLVLGVIGIFSKNTRMDFDVMKVDLPMLIGATFFLAITLWDLQFTLFEAILALLFLGLYLAFIVDMGKSEANTEMETEGEEVEGFSWKEPVILLVSGYIIYLSAVYNIRSIISLGEILTVPKEIIALTAVALGTSLPELIVSIVAVKKGFTEMAVGNILGSNIFNIFAVMGVPSFFGEVKITPIVMNYFALPLAIVVTLVAFVIIREKVIRKWEGGLLVALYIGYLCVQVFSL